jgi:hypothetical protein
MVTYTPNIPQPQDIPAKSQSQILQNFQYLVPSAATTGLKRDHQMLLVDTVNTDGVHKQVTFAANQTTPGFTGNVGVVYSNSANGQSQLFFNNAAQNVQLTTAVASVPTIAANGATFLPGGLLLQWGSGTSGAAVVFPVAFTAAIFAPRVTVTPAGGTGSTTTPPVITTLPTATGFNVGNNGGQVFQYYWMAIGQAP